MTRFGIEPQCPGPLANTLLIRLLEWFIRKLADRKNGKLTFAMTMNVVFWICGFAVVIVMR